MKELGTFVRVFYVRGESNDFDMRHYSMFDRLFCSWIAEREDSIIKVKDVNGTEILLSASNILSIHVSTPECREAWYRRDAAFDQENAVYEAIHGGGDDDEMFT